MFLVRLVGYQQDKQQVDRLAVGCVESDAFFQRDQRAQRVTAVIDTAVGNGDTFSKACRSQLFPFFKG